MTGVRLEAHVQLITAQRSYVQNLLRCFENLGLEVDGIVFQGLASAEAVLSPEEKDLGVLLIDFGGIGFGEASGEERAQIACENAILNTLLDINSISGAKGLLLNISVHPETLTVYESQLILNRVTREIDDQAKVFFGITFDESLGDSLCITIVATRLEKTKEAKVGSSEKIMKLPRKEETRGASDTSKLRELLEEDFLDIPTILRKSAE